MSASESLPLDQTRALWERARRVMPGGVNASARANGALGHPLFFQRGEGAYLYDVDGHRYVDYCTSHGASLLGHGHPAIVQAVQEALSMGILLACETEIQVEVAEQLLALFPGMEMVRYACSGTETTWHALRVARAYTGRWGVVKFEGHYHGVNDTVGYSHWPDLDAAGRRHPGGPEREILPVAVVLTGGLEACLPGSLGDPRRCPELVHRAGLPSEEGVMGQGRDVADEIFFGDGIELGVGSLGATGEKGRGADSARHRRESGYPDHDLTFLLLLTGVLSILVLICRRE